MRFKRVIWAGAVALACAPAASGEVIMSNIAFADDVGGTLFGPGSTTIYKAYGWTMPNDAYFLDEVFLRLSAYDTDEARVSIWDGDTLPENELLVLDSPVGPGMGGYFTLTFTPPETFIFEANTTYWVYVEANNGGGDGFLWGDTTPSTPPSGIGTDVGFVFNGNPSTFRNALEITGTLVPEPATVLLVALIGLLPRRR